MKKFINISLILLILISEAGAAFGIGFLGEYIYSDIYREWKVKQTEECLETIKVEAMRDYLNAKSHISKIQTQYDEKYWRFLDAYRVREEYIIPILENASIKGNSEAQYLLARYYIGWEVFISRWSYDRPKVNHEKAAYWFLKAAEQGHLTAQACLGMRYKHGEGVKQDFKECIKWLTSAAEKGECNAQYWLGELYSKGLYVKSGKVYLTTDNCGNIIYVSATCWYDGKTTEAWLDDDGDTKLSKGADIYYLTEYNESPVESKGRFLSDVELSISQWTKKTTYLRNCLKIIQ